MSELFSQISAWPLTKVLTAHVRRDENLLLGTTEKLPLVPGQFSSRVSVYFDEVYFTDVDKGKYFLHTVPDSTMRSARSRKFKLPTKQIETDYRAIMDYVAKRKVV